MPADRGGSWGNPRTTTAAWRNLRLVILERDGYRCTRITAGIRCCAPANEVDHIDGNHLNNNPDNLAALCTPCHRHKSSAEGHAARRTQQQTSRHPDEPHPGLA